MSRLSHQERGARIARWQASEMLQAHFAPDLFPHRLKPAEVKLWQGIEQSSSLEISDCAALREALNHA